MDRKSLFSGMALGAGIALTGMMLGGQGQQPAAPQFIRDLQVERLEVTDAAFMKTLAANDIAVVNRGGKAMIELNNKEDLGEIVVKDARDVDLVRISGILRGGGRIATMDGARTITEMGSSGQGGAFTCYALDGQSAGRLWAQNAGALMLGQEKDGTTTIDLPAQIEEFRTRIGEIEKGMAKRIEALEKQLKEAQGTADAPKEGAGGG